MNVKNRDSYGIALPLQRPCAWQHGAPPPNLVAAMPTLTYRYALCLLLVCSLATPHAALAKKKHRGGGSTQTQRSSSEETKAERERRLTRECKGMPNAGACLGYVHR